MSPRPFHGATARRAPTQVSGRPREELPIQDVQVGLWMVGSWGRTTWTALAQPWSASRCLPRLANEAAQHQKPSPDPAKPFFHVPLPALQRYVGLGDRSQLSPPLSGPPAGVNSTSPNYSTIPPYPYNDHRSWLDCRRRDICTTTEFSSTSEAGKLVGSKWTHDANTRLPSSLHGFIPRPRCAPSAPGRYVRKRGRSDRSHRSDRRADGPSSVVFFPAAPTCPNVMARLRDRDHGSAAPQHASKPPRSSCPSKT